VKRWLAILCGVLAASSCGRKPPPLKLAVITPLTGSNAAEGVGYDRAVRLAVEDAAKAGLPGREVVVVTFDDQALPDPAVEAARAVAADPDFFAVIGPMNSAPAMAAGRVLAFKGVVMLTTAGSSEVTLQQEEGGWSEQRVIFQMTPSSSRQGDWDAEYATRKLGMNRFAVLHDGGVYGRNLSGYFSQGFTSRGGQVVFNGAGGPDAASRANAVTIVAALQPQGVFFGGMPDETGAFMREARAAGYRGVFMAGGGARRPRLFDSAGEAARGAYMSLPGLVIDRIPSGVEFVERYRKRWGEAPRMMDHYAYDAARIALWAMHRTKGDRRAAADAIRSEPHETFMGTMRFDGKGLSIKSFVSMTLADPDTRSFPPAD
jgi:branched-chain amino acid transport system substrate-binding protein